MFQPFVLFFLAKNWNAWIQPYLLLFYSSAGCRIICIYYFITIQTSMYLTMHTYWRLSDWLTCHRKASVGSINSKIYKNSWLWSMYILLFLPFLSLSLFLYPYLSLSLCVCVCFFVCFGGVLKRGKKRESEKRRRRGGRNLFTPQFSFFFPDILLTFFTPLTQWTHTHIYITIHTYINI